jgi:hypothetical protein
MATSPWRDRRAPLLGEHNLDVYCAELGMSRPQVCALRAAGVV